MGTCNGKQSEYRSPIINPFFLPNTKQLNQHDTLQQYSFISNYDDQFLGRCSLLQKISTQNLYLSKNIDCNNDQQKKITLSALKSKQIQQLQVPSILKIKFFSKQADNFIGKSHKITLIMEYPIVSLKKQHHNRQLNQIQFSTSQIANILHATIKGYAALQRNNSINQKVRLAHIFFVAHNKQINIKVIDSQILPTQSNFQNLRKNTNNPAHYDVYLAPEEFTALMSGLGVPLFTRNKSGVFSLGASILQLCISKSSRDYYEFHRKSINEDQMQSCIKIAKKKHGSIIYRFLSEMLKFDHTVRPSFIELEKMITENMSEAASIPFALSTIRDDNQKYVHNDPSTVGENKLSFSNRSSIFNSYKSVYQRVFTGNASPSHNLQEQMLQNVNWKYQNGAVYSGTQKDQTRHGEGRYTFKDGSYYQGQWRQGYMSGYGVLHFSNGKIQYQGQWLNDQYEGWGVLYASQNEQYWDQYEGEFSHGFMHGRGCIMLRDMSKFEGEFRNGKIVGYGIKTYTDGRTINKLWPITSIHELYNTK